MASTLAAATCVDGGITAGSSFTAPALIMSTGVIGVLFSIWLLATVAAVKLDVTSVAGSGTTKDSAMQNTKLKELYDAITLGAGSFMTAEYKLCAIFVLAVFRACGSQSAPCPASPSWWARSRR